MLKSTSFVFDGISSEAYNLMIYFLSDSEMRELPLGTDVEIIEDRLPKRVTPIHYGVDMNKAMTFPLTFGSTEYLEDYDVDAILSWLTGHQQYKWLEFLDGDHYVRYKCYLNNVQSVYINGLPVAFTCDVVCDSQFAYEYPRRYEYKIDSTEAYIEFLNKSSYNGYLYPKMTLEFGDDCNSLTITNESDNGRQFVIDYFDREVSDTSSLEYVYNSNISSEVSTTIGNEDFISWQMGSIGTVESCNEIIKGTIGEGTDATEIWVAFISNSDKTYYSEDRGISWQEASPSLPQVGNWTGCFGENGFVAICTDDGQAAASHSLTGKGWTNTVIELPTMQKWNKVVFVETDSFMPNQYLAIGGTGCSAAITATGWGWHDVSLPTSQEWRSAFSGNGKAFIVGGNSNTIVASTDCVNWNVIELPKFAAWSDGCYGANGFILVADTLYGSGTREAIALQSVDGAVWNTITFPIGNWSSIEFGNSQYMAIADKQFVYSFDAKTWNNSTLPLAATSLQPLKDSFLCAVGNNKFIKSNSDSMIRGSFEIKIPAEEDFIVDNIYVSAFIDNDVTDTSYSSNGKVLLATHIDEVVDKETSTVISEAEITGGDFVSVTTDLRHGIGIDGIVMAATIDVESRIVKVDYIADSNHVAPINAPLQVSIQYSASSVSDLGYDGLVVEFDNANQIITTNKESLNMYEYFNKKFFRLIKGLNKLKIKTGSGTCKLILDCEFLRKVGGR